MSYKRTLQLYDLDSGEWLELHCNACGRVRKVTEPHRLEHPKTGHAIGHFYLDEFERRVRCRFLSTHSRGPKYCGGTVRLLIVDPSTKPVPFTAGMVPG